jgi:UDPglucose 6-dehydrogenase
LKTALGELKMNNSIGIIGQGFVGTATHEGLRDHFEVYTYDKFLEEKSTCPDIREVCHCAKIVFVCLPTPMKKDGSCDLSILEEVVYEIDGYNLDNIVVIKSTIPPGTTARFNEKCKNIQVVFNPEFLTEANYIDDFKNQNRIIIGGPRPASTLVKNMFRKVFQEVPIIKTGSNTAESVKYFINTFLATKVSFSNEFKQICDNVDVDYDKVVEYALYDERLGKSHFSTPGPDGRSGFGGSCFPKDINALIYFAGALGVKTSVLSAVWEKNLEVRPEKDWEQLKGRAISEDN